MSLYALFAPHVNHTRQPKLSALLVLSVKLRNFAHPGNQCALKSLLERATSLKHPNLLDLRALNSHQFVLQDLCTRNSNIASTNLAALIFKLSRLLALIDLQNPKAMSLSDAL